MATGVFPAVVPVLVPMVGPDVAVMDSMVGVGREDSLVRAL